MTRAVTYIRVSTAMQERDGVSLEAQEEMARDYCARKGWTLGEPYIDVMSGTSDKRPRLIALLADAKARRFDVVICYKIDRLSRNVGHFHEVMDTLERHRIELVSLTQDLDTTTASGRLMLNILISMAQNESEIIGERVSLALRYKAGQGTFTPNRTPMGYRYIPTHLDADGIKHPGRIEVDEAEAAVIRLVFEWYARTLSMRQVAIRLNSEGYVTRRGGIWRSGAVARIIENPIYKGDRVHGRHARVRSGRKKIVIRQPDTKWITHIGAVPGIVDADLWDACAARKLEKAPLHPRSQYAVARHTWASLCRCEGCGASLVRVAHTDKRNGSFREYYECIQAKSGGPSACDYNGRASVPFLEGVVLPAIASAFDAVKLANAVAVPGKRPKPRVLVSREKLLAQFDERERRAKRMYAALEATDAEHDAAMAAIRAEREVLLSREDAPAPELVPPEDFMAAWEYLDPAERGRLLRSFVSHIQAGRFGVVVHFHPFNHPAWPTEPLHLAKKRVRRWQKRPGD